MRARIWSTEEDNMGKVVGRDPIFVVQTVVTLLLALTLFFNFTPTVQGLVTALVVAVGGVVSAWLVAAEKAVPLLEGLMRALLALVAGLGVDIPTHTQAALFATLSVLVAFWLRTQVVAPVRLADTVRDVVPPITRSTGGHV
jgi:hypothetical protein